jgi:hypothetical protein
MKLLGLALLFLGISFCQIHGGGNTGGGGGGAPTGSAGGQLSGSYPNPGFANPATFPGNVTIGNTNLNTNVNIVGDSLVLGNQALDGVTIGGALQSYIRSYVFSFGVGGETSTQIAIRTGCINTTATVSGSSIPASGGVTVVFPTGSEPVAGASAPVNGTLNGVYGAVSLSGATYTFTRITPGTAVSSSGSVPFVADPGVYSVGPVVYWMGTNDISAGAGSVALVEGNVAACYSHSVALGQTPLFLTPLNTEGEGSGTNAYTYATTIASWMTSNYPSNTIDIRQDLVNWYNPSNAVDVWDNTAGIPAYTLRAVDKNGVLTTALSTTSACPVSSSTIFGSDNILLIGSEYIYVLTVSGSAIATCTRGYAGTTATTYSNGASFTGVDIVHLSGLANAGALGTLTGGGYQLVAQTIRNWLVANYAPLANPLVPNQTINILSSRGYFTSWTNTIFNSPILVGGPTGASQMEILADGSFGFNKSLICSAAPSCSIGEVGFGYTGVNLVNGSHAALLSVDSSGDFLVNANIAFNGTTNIGNSSTLLRPTNAWIKTGVFANVYGLTGSPTIYSAAGTALPACALATLYESLPVSDATTQFAVYVGGGTYSAWVDCTYNSSGTTYAWQVR